MVASITFRLKSSNHVGTIDMEGSVMSCRDAQQAIAQKLRSPPEEIHVFLAGSTALLHPDESLPAYAVVDVVRQTYSGKPLYLSRPKLTPFSAASDGAPGALGLGSLPASGDGHVLTEEERLAQLQAEAALDTGIDEVSSRFRRGGMGRGGMGRGGSGRGGMGGADMMRANMEENFRPPPRGYICHNCGKGGHLIQHCPSAKGGTAMKVLSFPVGIPESMLEECTMDDPAPKFITRDHRLVKRRVDPSVFTAISIAGMGVDGVSGDGGIESDSEAHELTADAEGGRLDAPAPVGNAGADSVTGAIATPSASVAQQQRDGAYHCVVHHGLAREAMKLPCCGNLLCEHCFTKKVEEALDDTRSLDDDEGGVMCPGCGEPLIMDEVEPALEEREKIRQLLLQRKRERDA